MTLSDALLRHDDEVRRGILIMEAWEGRSSWIWSICYDCLISSLYMISLDMKRLDAGMVMGV